MDSTPQTETTRRGTGWQALAGISLMLAAALLLYLNFQSIGLDDFDSYSFALALYDFDVRQQQPQPPGFPLYVAAGRWVQDQVLQVRIAYTLLSAVTGAVGIVAVALVGWALGNLRAGVLAALWLLVLPAWWIHSELVLSDIPGMALTLLATGMLLAARPNPSNGRDRSRSYRMALFLLACFVTGIALGVRPQNGLPMALAGLWALWAWRGHWLVIVSGLSVGALSIMLWLIPTLERTEGGFSTYWVLARGHSQHLVTSDSLVGQGITLETTTQRLSEFTDTLIWIVGSEVGVALVIAIMIVIGLLRVQWRTPLALFCLIWFALNTGKLFLFESLERPRLFLPILPPLMLLVAAGWMRFSVQIRALALLPVILFLWQSVPLVTVLTQELPPPQQATDWIAATYPLDETFVLAQGSFRATQYHLSGYEQFYAQIYDTAVWRNTALDQQPRYLLVLDADSIPDDRIQTLVNSLDFVFVDEVYFERDRRAFPQHDLVRVQIYERE